MRLIAEIICVGVFAVATYSRDYSIAAAFMAAAVYTVVCGIRDKIK